MRWKKYLKIVSGIIITITVIWLGYYFWQRLNLTETLFGPKEDKQVITAQNIKTLSDTSIFDYWINKKTNTVYYITKAGQIVKLTANSEELVNSQTVNGLNSILASADGTYAVAKFNYPNLPTFSIFNTITNNWQPLPINTLSVAWSPDTPELLYLDNKGLKIYNVANQKTQEVLKINQKDLKLDWISKETVLLSTTPTIETQSILWSLNLSDKTLLPLIQDEVGLMTKWSKDSEFGIKLHNQNRKPFTSLIDKNGATIATFTFITLPSKCLIENKKIYCAIPQNIREGLRLPDDYYKKSVYFDDGIYLVDLTTGSTKILLEDPSLLIDAEHLELHEGKLLFKNRLDEKLYTLELK